MIKQHKHADEKVKSKQKFLKMEKLVDVGYIWIRVFRSLLTSVSINIQKFCNSITDI